MHEYGRATESDRRQLYDAGNSKQMALDAVSLFATIVLSNYTNHVTETPLDDKLASIALVSSNACNVA